MDYTEDRQSVDALTDSPETASEFASPAPGVRNRRSGAPTSASAFDHEPSSVQEDLYSIQNTDLVRAKELAYTAATSASIAIPASSISDSSADNEQFSSPTDSADEDKLGTVDGNFVFFYKNNSRHSSPSEQQQQQQQQERRHLQQKRTTRWPNFIYAYAFWLDQGETMTDLVFVAVGIEMAAALGFMIFFFIEASTWTYSGATGVLWSAILYTLLFAFMCVHYFSELIYYLYTKKSILDTAPVDSYRMAKSLRAITIWCITLTFVILWLHYILGVGFDIPHHFDRRTLHAHGASSGDIADLHYKQRPAYSLAMALYFVFQLIVFLHSIAALFQYDDDENPRRTAARLVAEKNRLLLLQQRSAEQAIVEKDYR